MVDYHIQEVFALDKLYNKSYCTLNKYVEYLCNEIIYLYVYGVKI